MMTDFSVLPTIAKARFARLSAAVSDVLPKETRKWTIETRLLSQNGEAPKIIEEVTRWMESGCLYIYTFHVVDKRVALSELVRAYANARDARVGGRAYARQNPASMCLYVGSSEKMHQRLKDHLGFGSKGTYALHLAYWAKSLGVRINFECAKYPAGITREVVQVLEDTLWQELLPMFGKQGAR